MTDLTYEELIKKEIDIYDREDVLKNYHLYDKRLKTIKQSIISHEKEIKKLKIYHERIMKDKVN